MLRSPYDRRIFALAVPALGRVWLGLAGLTAVRLATCAARFASSRWALTGAAATS